jgi:hypothetical protein
MSIAHPAALLGLLLLPLIILFYMWRARHQRQVVSSTWLWSEVHARFSHQPTRRLPLREPLLILQLLAALALTLLLAGPALSRPARIHRIIVLDGSMTMAATDVRPDRWTAARQRIRTLLDQRGSDTTISLILAGAQARLLGEAPGDSDLTRILDQLPPPAGTADLTDAATLARGLANAGAAGASRVIFLAGAQTPVLPLPGLSVETQRLGGTLDDQGISQLTIRCLSIGSACQAFARVRNMAGAPCDDTFAVWAEGQLLGQQALQLPAGGALDLDFAVPDGARVVRASLLRHDALAIDNTAWAIVPAPAPLSTLLVSDSPGQLLPALRAVPGLRLQVTSTNSYQDTEAAGKDLVIMDGYTEDTLPSNPLLLLNPPADTTLLQVKRASTFLPITQVDPADPVVAGLDLYHLSISGEVIATPGWAHVAAGGPHGPVVLHGTLAGQRIAVLPWDAGHSAAAQDAVFPLLIEHLVRWLTPQPPPTVALGAIVTLPATVESVRGPSGALLSGPLVTADQAGVYRIDGSFGAWQSGDPLFVVPAASAEAVAPAAPSFWTVPHPSGTLPLALWPLVLAAALAALGGEWWFYARKT